MTLPPPGGAVTSPHHRLHPRQRPRHGSGEGREGAPEAPLGTAGLVLQLAVLPQPHWPPQGVFSSTTPAGGAVGTWSGVLVFMVPFQSVTPPLCSGLATPLEPILPDQSAAAAAGMPP
jgi:hypothetical protein